MDGTKQAKTKDTAGRKAIYSCFTGEEAERIKLHAERTQRSQSSMIRYATMLGLDRLEGVTK